MRYLLDRRFRLRGWDRLPFGLFDTETHNTDFYGREMFLLLSRCDGVQDIDVDALPQERRAWLENMEKAGVIARCEPGSMLLPEQLYHKYPCRYKRRVHWAITGRCNYKCKHCLVSAPHAKFGHPTTQQLLDLVDQMAECGIATVAITGGEPLIRDDFWQIIDALVAHEIGVSAIFTNGYLVNDALLDGLETRGLHPSFQMSYDGVGWHDWLRGFKGAEEAVDRAFALLQKRGYHADAAMCLHRGNIGSLRDTVRHLAALGVSSLKVNRIQELGEWENASQEVALTPDESLQVYLDFIPQYFEDGALISLMLDGAFNYMRDEPQLFRMEYERHCPTDATSERRLSCGVLKGSFYLGSDGMVCPCMSMTAALLNDWPNAFEMPLREILGDTPFMARCATTIGQVRDGNNECRTCPWIEQCTGGCRAAAACSAPSMTAVDPDNCNFFRGGWSERFREVAQKSLDAFLAAHPELAVAPKMPIGEREDVEYGI